MPSFFSLSKVALIATGAAAHLGFPAGTMGSPAVCTNPQQSCKNTTVVSDLCCFNAPGGQLLQTQFWDSSPAIGPADSFTLHGLWPDHCDGTFSANCDPARAYTNISDILTAAQKTDLLTYMQQYWLPNSGSGESFWEHEWSKHGTCISTLDPSCYTNYVPQQEVVEFFQTAVDLFKKLDSYSFLKSAGIVPSTSKTYTSAAILTALAGQRNGTQAVIQCTSGALNQIWYFYEVKGSVSTGTFIPTAPDGAKSNCPSTGVKYLPKA